MRKFKIFSIIISLTVMSMTINAQQLIGAVNMLSNRIIQFDKHYELIMNITLNDYVIQNNSATTLQEAIDKTVMGVPCGEFIMNAQIYMIDNRFVVVGDVWGEKHNYCLYQVGDLVSWDKKKMGTIVSIKDDDECMVKDLQNGRVKEMDFDDLTLMTLEGNNKSFKVGDKVTWKVLGGIVYRTGVVISIKDSSSCLVKDSQNGATKEMYFQNLFKLEE